MDFRRLVLVVGLAVVAATLSGLLFATSFGVGVNNRLLDDYFILRGPKPPSDEIVIVAIDAASVEYAKRKLDGGHITLATYVQMASDLLGVGAKAVVLDFLLGDTANPQHDLATLQALQKAKIVVAGCYFETLQKGEGFETAIFRGPSPEYAPYVKPGLTTLTPDADRVLRTVKLQTVVKGKPYYPLAVQAIAVFLNQDPGEVVRSIPESFMEDPATQKLRIDFMGPAGTFPTASFMDVFEDRDGTRATLFRGKLVIIGGNTLGAKSRLVTPFAGGGDQDTGTFGAEIHANIAHTLLHGGVVHVSRSARIGLMFLLALLAGLLSNLRYSRMVRLGLLTGLLATIVLGSILGFVLASVWFPVYPFVLSAILVSAWFFMPEKKGRAPVLPRRSVLTLCVVDMCKSTEISNTQGDQFATRLKDELRRIILESSRPRGVRFSKGTGDGMLLGFNSVQEVGHTAFVILHKVLNRNRQFPPQEQIHVRIALHLGEVNWVDVEGAEDIEGDAVNMVCRIEGLKAEDLVEDVGGVKRRNFPVQDRIFASEAAHDRLRSGAEFSSRYIGFFDLKGIKGRHRIFQILE
jgi:CHASE2 domain-containing sensor protein/class 3 adenylate cyclase